MVIEDIDGWMNHSPFLAHFIITVSTVNEE